MHRSCTTNEVDGSRDATGVIRDTVSWLAAESPAPQGISRHAQAWRQKEKQESNSSRDENHQPE